MVNKWHDVILHDSWHFYHICFNCHFLDGHAIADPLYFFLHLFWKRTCGDKWLGFFTGQMPFISLNQQCQSTKGSTKY